MTPDYLAGFEAGRREALRLLQDWSTRLHCGPRPYPTKESKAAGDYIDNVCFVLHARIEQQSPPESIASTPEALAQEYPHIDLMEELKKRLAERAAHTQTEEKPGMPTATASLTCPWCGKALKVATFGPCFECLAKAERPERQEQTKHEKKSARSTYCRCGYPWIGDRCASPDVERPESQEKPKEEA